jgi:hypothetical protein
VSADDFSVVVGEDGAVLVVESRAGAPAADAGEIAGARVGDDLPRDRLERGSGGTRLAVTSYLPNEVLLDTTTMRPLAPCDIESGAPAWSADGTHLAVAGHVTALAVVDSACRREFALYGSHAAEAAYWTPDGTELLSTDLIGTRLWDVASGRQIGTNFADSSYFGTGYGLTADHKLFTTAQRDHQLMLIDIDPTSWLTHACTVAGRNLTTDEWNRYLSALGPYRATCPSARHDGS